MTQWERLPFRTRHVNPPRKFYFRRETRPAGPEARTSGGKDAEDTTSRTPRQAPREKKSEKKQEGGVAGRNAVEIARNINCDAPA